MSSAIPIRQPGEKAVPLQLSRDSFAHSSGMGGISWGGASVGSWLRDEVLMATKEPSKDSHANASQPFELAGPELTGPEAAEPALHDTDTDLPRSTHRRASTASLDQPAYFPSIEANFCRDYSCCGKMLPTLHDLLRHYEEQHISPSPPEEPPVMRRVQNIETVSTNDVFLPFDAPDQQQPDLALPDMDLDSLDLGLDDGPPAFAPPSFQPLSQNMLAQGVNKPADINPGFGQPQNNGINPGMAGGMGQNILNPGLNPMGSGLLTPLLGDDDEPTIDDPARQLYMLERTENKPFKCPVIGCEKTYKNQNGLKYHRQHGHQNQTLHQNDDGTISIIDPLSNTPYPDGMGMEKDKPYRCEICGKRYKNLNGLKYHRAHSTH